MVGRLVPFWEGPFSGAMLVLGRVLIGTFILKIPTVAPVPSWRQVCRFVVLETSQRCCWSDHRVLLMVQTSCESFDTKNINLESCHRVSCTSGAGVCSIKDVENTFLIFDSCGISLDVFLFYLEPNWPLFLRGWPSIIGSNHPKFGSFGLYHVIYIYKYYFIAIYIYIITCIHTLYTHLHTYKGA